MISSHSECPLPDARSTPNKYDMQNTSILFWPHDSTPSLNHIPSTHPSRMNPESGLRNIRGRPPSPGPAPRTHRASTFVSHAPGSAATNAGDGHSGSRQSLRLALPGGLVRSDGSRDSSPRTHGASTFMPPAPASAAAATRDDHAGSRQSLRLVAVRGRL